MGMMRNNHISQEKKCSVCNSTETTDVVEIRQVPVHCNLLWPDQEGALQAPRGDIQLGFCQDCGHIFNRAFRPELMDYAQAYENSLHFSPRFQSYAKRLAVHIIDRYDLRNKDVIEIGCGQGDFLRLLCELGDNRGVGFDPSYVDEGKTEATRERMTFIQDFYSERYAGYTADFICCRHVLEHIQFPGDFLKSVRRSIGDRQKTTVFFEVPNILFTVRDLGIWDLIYEHCSYFSPSSLCHLFTSQGFDVFDLRERYGGQFLSVEAFPGAGVATTGDFRDNLDKMASLVATFADKYHSKIEMWLHNLEQITSTGQRAVVWGGGSKGVTFLNALKIRDQIAYVVDINPRKHGKYVAGTAQQIVPPEFLRDYKPDVVIMMNPIYEREIREIAAGLDLSPEFIQV